MTTLVLNTHSQPAETLQKANAVHGIEIQTRDISDQLARMDCQVVFRSYVKTFSVLLPWANNQHRPPSTAVGRVDVTMILAKSHPAA
jgi:hypothetical protein